MDLVYFKGLCDYINNNNLNLKGDKIRRCKTVVTEENNKTIYENEHYVNLVDTALLDNQLLRYRMGDSSRLKMLNIALLAKGSLCDRNKGLSVDIQTSSTTPGSFTLYFQVEEQGRHFARLQLSNDRTYNVVSQPNMLATKQTFDELIEDFMTLINTP